MRLPWRRPKPEPEVQWVGMGEPAKPPYDRAATFDALARMVYPPDGKPVVPAPSVMAMTPAQIQEIVVPTTLAETMAWLDAQGLAVVVKPGAAIAYIDENAVGAAVEQAIAERS